MPALSPIFNGYQSFTSGGLPNAGGFIYTYAAGTTTPLATYTTNGTTANTNPIALSASGVPPNEIWLTTGSAYKFVVTDSTTATIGTYENIQGISPGPLAGMRNKLINGLFSINQRAVSGTVTLAAGVYGHDRWKAGSGGCVYTFSASANGMQITITSGTLMQVIEGANLEGGTFTLSWFGTATGRVDSGAYSASGVAGTAVAGTNQAVEFSIGTLARVQYEFGSMSTVFEQRLYGLELALCQRYYETSADIGTAPINGGSATAYSGTPVGIGGVQRGQRRVLSGPKPRSLRES